jgi:Periplasmic binding protein
MRFKGSLIAAAACAAVAVGVVEAIPAASAKSKASVASSSGLGSQHAAKGSPVVFGAINIETQQSANFPEVRLAANAMVSYLNAYRGGLDGHPIKVDWCITDGTPSVSSNCAKQLIADHPVAILGAADISGPSRRHRRNELHAPRKHGEQLADLHGRRVVLEHRECDLGRASCRRQGQEGRGARRGRHPG